MGKFALGCVGILVVLAVIVGLSFAGTYNRLVTLGQDVDKSWSEVENQYQRRADLVPNLVATVQGYAKQEKDVLTEVTEARAAMFFRDRRSGEPQLGQSRPQFGVISLVALQHGAQIGLQVLAHRAAHHEAASVRADLRRDHEHFSTRLKDWDVRVEGLFLGYAARA